MSEIIKQINVGGVDYDIVSESAEKKIAELEKNNAALASITFESNQGDPIKVGLGTVPEGYVTGTDIYVGVGAYLERGVTIGSTGYLVDMGWKDYDTFRIRNDYNSITIGSDGIVVNGTPVGSSGSNSYIESYDGTKLWLGEDSSIVADHPTIGTVLTIGTGTHIAEDVNIGASVAIGTWCWGYGPSIAPNIQIGTTLHGGKLHIRGPVYLEAKESESSLTIGTDSNGAINIDWSEDGKIVFTNIKSGKKATLTLS